MRGNTATHTLIHAAEPYLWQLILIGISSTPDLLASHRSSSLKQASLSFKRIVRLHSVHVRHHSTSTPLRKLAATTCTLRRGRDGRAKIYMAKWLIETRWSIIDWNYRIYWYVGILIYRYTYHYHHHHRYRCNLNYNLSKTLKYI